MPDHESGPWSPPAYAPAVGLNDIRRWVIATYWPEPPPPLYVDPAYAATTRWAGIIAPRDFNPFTWLVDPPARLPEETAEFHHDRPHVMNGGNADRYGEPIRPGDVIRARRRLCGIQERTTRLGRTRFITTEQEWTNQAGALVRLRVNTLIRYAR
jgi:acyl dehydratase